MRRALLLLLLVVAHTHARADNDVRLSVKPVLCVLDKRTTACEMAFVVAWQSAVEGYYCLYNHYTTAPLRCWPEARSGSHEEQRSVERGFQFWLTADGNDEPVATAAVDVMTTASTDRRRKRRTRHVWDLN